MLKTKCSYQAEAEVKLFEYFSGLDGANRSVISAGILLLWSGGGGVEKLILKLTSSIFSLYQ